MNQNHEKKHIRRETHEAGVECSDCIEGPPVEMTSNPDHEKKWEAQIESIADDICYGDREPGTTQLKALFREQLSLARESGREEMRTEVLKLVGEYGGFTFEETREQIRKLFAPNHS